MEQIITSLFDNDFYKFSQQFAVMELFGNDVPVTYQFNNRRKEDKFTQEMVVNIREQIDRMEYIKTYDSEMWTLSEIFPFFSTQYIKFLSEFKFDPTQVNVWIDKNNDLQLTISGPWHTTILWEVPLMAIISEVYFHDKILDGPQMNRYYEKTKEKYTRLKEAGCKFSDFGTRRRRSKQIHDMVTRTFDSIDANEADFVCDKRHSVFLGTSNVKLGMSLRCPIIGTQAHEFYMGCSAKGGLEFANRNAMQWWADVYCGSLGVALTDTFGTSAFFKDFDGYLARLYDGVRHDSGDPIIFADRVVRHYEKLNIDPMSKKIIFSDGLNVDECIKIQNHINGRIKCSFGIGTDLTNDKEFGRSLNMVIKLRTAFGKEVVKISDNPEKATGDAVALAEAFSTFGIQKKGIA